MVDLKRDRLVLGLVLIAGITLAGCARATPAVPTPTPEPTNTAPPPTATIEAPTPEFEAVGQDIHVELPPGDPESGARYWQQKEWDCAGCHETLLVGPPLRGNESRPGIATIAVERLEAQDYEGEAQNVREYLFESIVHPGAYVVDGFTNGLMPDRLGDLMTPQEIADMIAFLMTLE